MRFDVLIKYRNFDSVAQMLHKKSHPRGMFPPEWLLFIDLDLEGLIFASFI